MMATWRKQVFGRSISLCHSSCNRSLGPVGQRANHQLLGVSRMLILRRQWVPLRLSSRAFCSIAIAA